MTELMQDRLHPTDWRVETILDDGAVEVTIFSGPNAEKRARTHYSNCGMTL